MAAKALVTGLALLFVATGVSACTTVTDEGEEEEAASVSNAIASGLACRVARSATATGVRLTLRAGAATAGCVAVAWTAAGVGELGCLAAAGTTVIGAITAALGAGVAYLIAEATCSR